MSIAVRTYSDLLARVQALAGKDSFTANEQTRILSLANARLYSAYRRCDYWPRYLYISEARYVDEDTIPYTQGSAVVVSGAGTDEVNGIYQPVDTLNTKTRYYLNGDTESYYLKYTTGEYWEIGLTGPLYSNSGGANPWTNNDYTFEDGASPAPTVTESTRANIDTFFRIFTGPVYGTGQTGNELDFYVDDEGAHPINNRESYTQLYVTYKAPWGGPYQSNSTSIPLEFFEYAAHGALADWLRSTGTFDQAQAEDAVAESMLNFELMRKQVQYNANLYAPRFNTYISRQARNV